MAVRPPESDVDLDGLFRAHATPLLRLAVVLTGDLHLAEELVQEAFVRLQRSGAAPAPGAELEPPSSGTMFDRLSGAFPCGEGYQTVFYLSPTASDTEEDDLAVRAPVSDLAGIAGIFSSNCTDSPVEPTGERPTFAVAVTANGRLVVIDVATGNEIREVAAFDDPTDPADAEQEGGPYVITGVALHPNGRDVYYDTCCEPASGHVERVSIDGSTAPEPITGAYGIDISADGRWLVGVAGGAGILLYDLEGGTGALLGNDNEAVGEWEQAAINADGTEVAVARSRP